MDPYDFILTTIKSAGDMVMQLRGEVFETSFKGGNPRDIVTSVDIKVNDFLVGEIKKTFPEHGVYSEEGGGSSSANEYQWAIDPIDGSANFSRGIPHFAVCIGLLQDGIPVAGAVYNPVTQELFSFKKGAGAFLNGKLIHVSGIVELSKAGTFLHAGRKKEVWDWGGESYKKLLAHAHKTSNYGGSALDVCFIAAGRIEAVIYGILSTIDIAAAFGILAEAGGVAAEADGKPITFSTEPRKWFAANNQKILDEIRTLLV